jgi:hypothetical protein
MSESGLSVVAWQAWAFFVLVSFCLVRVFFEDSAQPHDLHTSPFNANDRHTFFVECCVDVDTAKVALKIERLA